MTSDDDIIYDDIFEAEILNNNGIFCPHQERELSFGSSTSYSSLADFTTTMSHPKTSRTKNDLGDLNIIATNNKSTTNKNNHIAPLPHEQKIDKTAAASNGATFTKKEMKYVTHHYRDFSHLVDPARHYFRTMQCRTNDLSKSLPTRRLGMANHFPIKLYHMLEHIDLHEPQLASVISWQPHGRCFKVRHPKIFEEILLQRFFKHHKYTSFQRQLNIYGFRRITSGEDRGSYYHELFLRGKKHLCYNMERTSVKGNGGRMAANPKSEPNFYAMPYLGPHHVSEIEDDDIISNIPFQTNNNSSSSSGRRMTNQELPVTNASPSCTKHSDRNDACATAHVNSNYLSGGGNVTLPHQQYHHNYHQQHQQQQRAANENAYQDVYQWRQNGDSSVFTQNDFYL